VSKKAISPIYENSFDKISPSACSFQVGAPEDFFHIDNTYVPTLPGYRSDRFPRKDGERACDSKAARGRWIPLIGEVTFSMSFSQPLLYASDSICEWHGKCFFEPMLSCRYFCEPDFDENIIRRTDMKSSMQDYIILRFRCIFKRECLHSNFSQIVGKAN